MSFGVVASVAGPLIGGMMASDSAEAGYDAQAKSAAASDATQRYMYDTTRADNAPFLRNGTNASNRLAFLMGLGGSGAAFTPKTADQLRQELIGKYTTSTGGTDPAMEQYIRDHVNSDSRPAPGSPVEQYIKSRMPAGDWSLSGGLYEQYMQSGAGAGQQRSNGVDEAGLQAAIQQVLANQGPASSGENDPAAGSLVRKFSQGDLESDVVYKNGLQFGLDEGRKGIERQQQASGGLLSGATLKALSRFGNDYGTTKTEGAYNRYTQDNTNTYNRLAGIAGSGQTASAQVGSAGQNYANNVSQTAQGLGNARAASGIASSNAISGGLQGAYNNYQGGQMLKTLQGGYRTPGYGVNVGSEPYSGYNASIGLG